MEDGEIQDLLIERASGKGIVGNIYKGRVTRVLPGMQAAFVDIGLERAGFLDFFNAIYGRMDTEIGLAVDNMPGMASPLAPWLKRVGEFKREVMRMSRGANYHSSFSILRTTTWVSRVKIPVGPQ